MYTTQIHATAAMAMLIAMLLYAPAGVVGATGGILRSALKRNLRPIHIEFSRAAAQEWTLSEEIRVYHILRNPDLTEADCAGPGGPFNHPTHMGDSHTQRVIGPIFVGRIQSTDHPQLNEALDRGMTEIQQRIEPIRPKTWDVASALTKMRAIVRLQCIVMIEGDRDDRPASDLVCDATEYVLRQMQTIHNRGGTPDVDDSQFLEPRALLRAERSRNPKLFGGTDTLGVLMPWFRGVRGGLNDSHRIKSALKDASLPGCVRILRTTTYAPPPAEKKDSPTTIHGITSPHPT